MQIPDSLEERIELFRANGVLREGLDELFRPVSWWSVLEGMAIRPATYHPLADRIDEPMLLQGLDQAREQLAGLVGNLPTHQAFIDAHCRAEVGHTR